MKESVSKQISVLEKALASPAMPENMKAAMQKHLDELKAKMEKKPLEAAPKKDVVPKVVPKEKKKRGRPAKEETKKEGAKKEHKEAAKKVVVDGKEISSSDADYCEKLLTAWAGRREKAKQSAKKHKTTPVFERITAKVEQAVTQAINTIPAKELAANPGRHIKSFEKLESSMKEFLQDFKVVVGDAYDSKDVVEAVAGINDLIGKLKKKFAK